MLLLITLVASKRPPKPTSSTTISHSCSEKYKKAIQVNISKKVKLYPVSSLTFLTFSVNLTKSASLIHFPLIKKRSLYSIKWGEMKVPTL